MKIFERLRYRRRGIFLIMMDVCILFLSNLLGIWMLNPVGKIVFIDVINNWVLLAVIMIIYMIIGNIGAHVWRYAGSGEFCAFINTYLLTFATGAIIRIAFNVGQSVPEMLITVLLALLCSGYARISYKNYFLTRAKAAILTNKNVCPIAIIGAGAAGAALVREIARNKSAAFSVWGFFDDDRSKTGMLVEGVKVMGTISSLPEIIKQSPVYDIILAIPSLDVKRRREIIDICSTTKCRLKIMPDIILSMKSSEDYLTKSIRQISIEDLLGRNSVPFNGDELMPFLHGKTVIVTGGGGSIGSELCRQIARAGARTLIIFDISENSSYLLENEIKQRINSEINVIVEIGSMVDERRVRDVFEHYMPQVVFHAAAHKHVPLMELCPYEAVQNNIHGTYNIVAAASEVKVEKFVFISTDKAVNPTSIMGATKRYCEDMIRAFSARPDNHTCFAAVRFGNVLGSNGSVIPIFQEQIANGGPVTITDKRITRYFMTIPEAVGLILKSGAMASSCETYILDMGDPVKIIDLAENLIRLSGMEPYRDIQIVEVGLRSGEKLYEELLVSDDHHVATKESKIFVEQNRGSVKWETISSQLSQLDEAVNATDNTQVLELIHRFVPDYKDADAVNSSVKLMEAARKSDGAHKAASGDLTVASAAAGE